jgi:hypothetical protein
LERALKSFAKYQITSYLYLAYFHTPHTKDGMTNFYVFYFHADALGGHPIGSPPPFFLSEIKFRVRNIVRAVSGSTAREARAMGNRSHVCAHADPLALVFFNVVHPIRREGCARRRRRVFSPRVFFCARRGGGGVAFPQCHRVPNLLKASVRNRKFTPLTMSLAVKIIFCVT